MFSNASFSASNFIIHLLLCPWSYTVGKAPSETSRTEGLSHCEISWFFPAHTWLCVCYAALHNCVLVWINVGRRWFPTSDMIRVLVTQSSWCPAGKPTRFILTAAFLPPQEDCAEPRMSRGKCWTADEVRTKFGLDCNPFLCCFPAKIPYTTRLGTGSMPFCLILLLYSMLV